MSNILFKPQPTEIEGYAHGQQDVLLRFAAGSIPSGLTVKVYSGLGQTLMPGFAPALAATGQTDSVFLRWTQTQKQAMSAYSSLWIELIWDGVCQLAGPLRMNLRPAAGPEVGLVTARTRTSGDVFVYADQLVSLALSIQADVTGKLGQINAVKQHVDQKSDHVDEQADHVDEQTDHVDQQKTLIDQAKQHIDGQANHVDEQTDHVDQQKTLIDQAKQHIDGQATHVDEQTDHVDQQKTLIDQAKQHIDGQATHVDEQTGHVDQQKTLIDQAKEHIDGQATHVDEQTDHVDQQKTLIDQAKQHIDGQVTHVDDQTDHVDQQKTLIDQQKALIDQAAQQVAQNAQTASDQAGIAMANRFIFKGSYQNNTVYAAGDGVMYANSFIRRKTAGSSGSTFVPGDWDFLAMGINLRGTYQNNTYYALNDLVIFRRSAYLAPANMTTGVTFNRVSWVRIAAGWNPAGAWTAAAAVYEDDILTNQGSTYRVTTDHTTPASFSTANLELIAAKGDPGTLTASAFPAAASYDTVNHQVAVQKGATLEKMTRNALLDFPGIGQADIRPSLLFDFANSRMVSPRIAVNRTGPATRINSAGVMEQVGVNVPRIDYDPVTFACLGVLVEEQRTNLFTGSLFTGGGVPANIPVNWGVSGVSAAAISIVDGGYLGSKIVQVRRNNGGWQGLQQAVNVTTGLQYIISVYVRVPTGTTPTPLTVQPSGSGGNFTLASTATLAAQPRDRWVRYWGTYTATATGSITFAIVSSTGTATDGTEGFDLQCPQIEQGAFVTSFIPTLSVTATRGADGLLFYPGSWRNPNAGTWLVRARGGRSSSQDYRARFLGGTVNPVFILGGYGAKTTLGTSSSSGTSSFGLAHTNNSLDIAAFFFTHAMSYDEIALNASVAFSGQVASSNYTGSYNFPSYIVGSYGTPGGGLAINGHVQYVAYYPKRLTDNQLITLTAN